MKTITITTDRKPWSSLGSHDQGVVVSVPDEDADILISEGFAIDVSSLDAATSTKKAN